MSEHGLSPEAHSGDAPPATRRLGARQIIGWLLGLGLLVFLLGRMPLRQVPHMLAVLPASVLLTTFAGLLCSYLLRAARLQSVLPPGVPAAPARRTLGLDWRALKVIFLHNGAINLIPMRAGELTFPWLAERHLGLPQPIAVATLVWMRLQDLVVLASLGVLLLPGLDLSWRLGLWLLGLLALFGLRLWARRSASGSASSTTLLPALRTVRQALADPTHHSWMAWVFSSANWCVKLAAGAVLLSALTGAQLQSGLTGALGGELAAVLPVQGPAGLGTYEAGVGLGMHWAHASAQGGVVLTQGATVWAALILHLLMLCSALVCAALGALMPTPSSASRRIEQPS